MKTREEIKPHILRPSDVDSVCVCVVVGTISTATLSLSCGGGIHIQFNLARLPVRSRDTFFTLTVDYLCCSPCIQPPSSSSSSSSSHIPLIPRIVALHCHRISTSLLSIIKSSRSISPSPFQSRLQTFALVMATAILLLLLLTNTTTC